MKTKLLKLVCSIIFLVISSNGGHAQLLASNYDSDFTKTPVDFSILDYQSVASSNNHLGEIPEALDPFNFIEANNPQTIEEMGTLETHDPASTFAFARTMLALGAGIGLFEDQTLWCLHGAYLMQLALFNKAALYGSLGMVLNGLSTDFLTSTFVDFQLKALMFSGLFQNHLVHFIWGAMVGYGLGTEKFKSGGGKYDITRLTAALVLGLNIYLTTRLFLMIQTNLLAHQSQTSKPDTGGEIKDNSTWFLINQNNILALSLVFMLGGAR